MVSKLHQMMAVAILAAVMPGGAQAQLLGSCTVVVHNQGKIALNAGGSELSSKNGGGSSVLATVTASAGILCKATSLLLCYGVSAPAPLLFASSPLDGSLGTLFTTTYRVDGGSELPGLTKTQLLDGDHNVELNMAASKAVGTFGAGDYRAEVLIRCE